MFSNQGRRFSFFVRKIVFYILSFLLGLVIKHGPKLIAYKAIELARGWTESGPSDRRAIGFEVQGAIAKRLGLKLCLYCETVLYPGVPHMACDEELDAEVDLLEGGEERAWEEYRGKDRAGRFCENCGNPLDQPVEGCPGCERRRKEEEKDRRDEWDEWEELHSAPELLYECDLCGSPIDHPGLCSDCDERYPPHKVYFGDPGDEMGMKGYE